MFSVAKLKGVSMVAENPGYQSDGSGVVFISNPLLFDDAYADSNLYVAQDPPEHRPKLWLHLWDDLPDTPPPTPNIGMGVPFPQAPLSHPLSWPLSSNLPPVSTPVSTPVSMPPMSPGLTSAPDPFQTALPFHPPNPIDTSFYAQDPVSPPASPGLQPDDDSMAAENDDTETPLSVEQGTTPLGIFPGPTVV